MKSRSQISRRDFLARTAGAAIGVGLGLDLAQRGLGGALTSAHAAEGEEVRGEMRYRRLGRSGVIVSVIAGAGRPETLYPRAIAGGINYWHKLGNWKPPEVLASLPRESFYCDMVIDHLEEDKAIEQFESGLAKSGLEMVDFFKVHSLYQDPGSIKQHPGVLKAFEKLKKQGKTRWLAISQHSNTGPVISACIESGLFDAIQISYNPGLEEECRELLALAKAHDVGVIAMKGLMGGPDRWAAGGDWEKKVGPHLGDSHSVAQGLLRFALAAEGMTAVVPKLANFDQLNDALAAAKRLLTAKEVTALTVFGGTIGASYCRMCGRCEETCPKGIRLAEIFRYQMYWRDYGEMERASHLYAGLLAEKSAAGCDDCGRCQGACPYGRQVASLLREAHTMLA